MAMTRNLHETDKDTFLHISLLMCHCIYSAIQLSSCKCVFNKLSCQCQLSRYQLQ